ncbi:MAG: 3-isopropylmalate dehydratase small subunit [Spirochaetota bacterium]|nr:3-isopropylmalate dehydratase small subunit [Spirochaetota bacterium]
MKIQGKVWKFGNDVNTDEIIPARYLNVSDPEELALHCMEDADSEFKSKISKGDIIVAGYNFGCGSSREHAPISIKAADISCVIASSFARIFFRNSINIGLPILESVEASEDIQEGDKLEVDFENGEIFNMSKGRRYLVKPFPSFIQEIISKGGLINKIKSELLK